MLIALGAGVYYYKTKKREPEVSDVVMTGVASISTTSAESKGASSGASGPAGTGTAAVPVAAAATHTSTSGSPAAMPPDTSSDETRLDKLTALYTAGRISKEVYEGKQREALEQMGL